MHAQKHRMVCHSLATNDSSQSEMALRMSCAPPKLMERVTVQLPTRVNQPVIQLAMGAHSGDERRALQ